MYHIASARFVVLSGRVASCQRILEAPCHSATLKKLTIDVSAFLPRLLAPFLPDCRALDTLHLLGQWNFRQTRILLDAFWRNTSLVGALVVDENVDGCTKVALHRLVQRNRSRQAALHREWSAALWPRVLESWVNDYDNEREGDNENDNMVMTKLSFSCTWDVLRAGLLE